MRTTILITLALIAIASATQYVPIPSKPDGIGFGNLNSTLVLDAWYDLTCPDSQYTYGELLTALKNQTLAPYISKIRINYHFMPLPFHYNSFYLAQVFNYLTNVHGNDAALVFVDKIFENQDQYANSLNQTTIQIFQMIADNTATYLSAFNVTSQQVFNSFQDSDYDSGARVSFKLGGGKTVTGTPTFFGNDAFINDAGDLDAKGWVSLILSIFNPDSEQITSEF